MKNLLAVIPLLLLLNGCAGRAPVPEDRFYQLEQPQPQSVLAKPVLTGGLEIGYTDADPLRSGRAILYNRVDEPLQVQRYHYEFWVDQPPRMVHQALLRYVRSAGLADAVNSVGQRNASAFRLQTHLLKFEQLRHANGNAASLALEVTLESLPSGAALWTKSYAVQRVADSDDIGASVRAMNQGLTELFGRLQADLASAGYR
jgi:ABC-type uncharacterized transport system auxiliary subunit